MPRIGYVGQSPRGEGPRQSPRPSPRVDYSQRPRKASGCGGCIAGLFKKKRERVLDSPGNSPLHVPLIRRERTRVAPKSGPILPAPFEGAQKVEEATLKDVPTAEALKRWLEDHGVPTATWGHANTKDVSKYWKEIKLDEAGLEVWRKSDGQLQTVRVTHVLRAKVASPSSYEKGSFLFNTWQQYGDGRKRTRNGLLSEKLCVSEMPLQDHLHEVCVRAVTEEEMQRVESASLRVEEGCVPPAFDPSYVCPLKVVHVNFVDHTIEIEESKSYPGLVTMYHLYTVDVVCSGLPTTDFNTLEFEAADAEGRRKLKYVHAWVWLGWSKIQRYLFEGSVLKERKTLNSFSDAAGLRKWLQQFDLDLDKWGTGQFRSVKDLFAELQNEKAGLELWGREDGVPLLMRVVHVLNLKVISSEPSLGGKLLFQTCMHYMDGSVRSVNRLPSLKLSTAELPFDEARFAAAAERAVKDRLSTIVDQFFSLDPENVPEPGMYPSADVKVHRVQFVDHRCDLEDSPSYDGLHTMYHLYTMEVLCDGLPAANFTSLDFSVPETVHCISWSWSTWQETLDIMHASAQGKDKLHEAQDRQLRIAKASADEIKRCIDTRRRGDIDRVAQLAEDLSDQIAKMRLELRECTESSLTRIVPPSVVSKLSERKLVSEKLLETAQRRSATYL